MSSQLKHWRMAEPGLPVMRRFLRMALRREHLSVMWKTSPPSHQVGGISGVRVGWSGKSRVGCMDAFYRKDSWVGSGSVAGYWRIL